MTNFPETTDESRERWEKNADHWDNHMGDTSNHFHKNIVRPGTEALLGIREGDLVLDIACGNGNFSQRLAELKEKVVAFDYSEKLIVHAKRRRSSYPDAIDFQVIDATNIDDLMTLKQEGGFDKAVSNMAVMDISNIRPLFQAVSRLLKPGGIFVFSTHHPCFVKPEGKYLTPCVHEGEGIRGQPVLQYYYHRPQHEIFQTCFDAGFTISGFLEEPDDDAQYPVIMIIRLMKNPDGNLP